MTVRALPDYVPKWLQAVFQKSCELCDNAVELQAFFCEFGRFPEFNQEAFSDPKKYIYCVLECGKAVFALSDLKASDCFTAHNISSSLLTEARRVRRKRGVYFDVNSEIRAYSAFHFLEHFSQLFIAAIKSGGKEGLDALEFSQSQSSVLAFQQGAVALLLYDIDFRYVKEQLRSETIAIGKEFRRGYAWLDEDVVSPETPKIASEVDARDSQLIEAEGKLSGRSLLRFQFLSRCPANRFVSYDTLKTNRSLWNGEEPDDSSITNAMERLRGELGRLSPPLILEVSHRSRRVKLLRPPSIP